MGKITLLKESVLVFSNGERLVGSEIDEAMIIQARKLVDNLMALRVNTLLKRTYLGIGLGIGVVGFGTLLYSVRKNKKTLKVVK